MADPKEGTDTVASNNTAVRDAMWDAATGFLKRLKKPKEEEPTPPPPAAGSDAAKAFTKGFNKALK